MKIAIMGTGGVGGYFGAKLALGGNDVSFIARGAHLAAIKSQGLTVRSPLGDMHVPTPRATDTPSDVGPVDVVPQHVGRIEHHPGVFCCAFRFRSRSPRREAHAFSDAANDLEDLPASVWSAVRSEDAIDLPS